MSRRDVIGFIPLEAPPQDAIKQGDSSTDIADLSLAGMVARSVNPQIF
jgi:hypothetical protein